MVVLVALLEPAQDRDRVVDVGLADEDRLEAPLQRRVFLDVLAVLVERRRPDRAQLAAGQHRLQQVGGVDRAFGGAGADDRVQLVEEEDDLALGLLDLGQDRFQPLLELAAVFRAGQQRADVERDHAPVAQALRHVAVDDPLRQPLDDRGLADAGVADQHRVVLGPAREDLDHAADLLVAADHRVELAGLRLGGQVAAEFLQRLDAVLGVGRGDLVRAAHLGDRLLQRVAVGEEVGDAGGGVGQRQQEVLGRDVLVAELRHLLLGPLQRLRPGAEEGRTSVGLAQLRQRPRPPRTARAAIAPTSAPSFCRIGTTSPRPARSSATSRWAGVISELRRSAASACAAATASWDLTVNRSGCTGRPILRGSPRVGLISGQMWVRRAIGPVLAAAAVLATVPATAFSAPVTIGQIPTSTPPVICIGGDTADLFQLSVDSGSGYVVPPGYTEITSWSTYASAGDGQVWELRVYDVQSETQYVVVRADTAHTLAASQLNTFPTDIPVGAGDVIGVAELNSVGVDSACSIKTDQVADQYGQHIPAIEFHTGDTFSTILKYRVNVSATLEAVPAVGSIGPNSGSAAGGASVLIAGHDLTDAKSVGFGDQKATLFKVESDNAIEAVAPAAAEGTVDVTVTNAAGTSPAVPADRFTYVKPSEGPPGGGPGHSTSPLRCVVPKLQGVRTGGGSPGVEALHCRVGRVRGPRGADARVSKQSAKAGKSLPGGTRVSVRLASPWRSPPVASR